ncbi:MAG: DUF1566 domain-containing protein, partial [Bacteroidales bacterium]|nr:DUF1566 domain-containing protein [Bacteroidales bacterium]
VYSTSSLPTVESTLRKLTVAVDNNSTFSATITGLTAGVGYYVRAYAVNKKGIAYSSNEVYFEYDTSNVYIIESLNLMVQKNDIPGGQFTWSEAKSQCKASRIAGFSDWRLPTLGELSAICGSSNISGFSNERYWTADFNNSGSYYVYMGSCSSAYTLATNVYKVRAVRTITE